jgi:UDP-2,3-diacylglucosamine pyrophosphatase LpxH
MSGIKRAMFVSDLHLGSNPTLDDFTRDREFEALLELRELKPRAGDQVDLVLLGDTFDLWQSVSENECRQARGDRIELAYTADSEARRLGGVRAKHQGWFEALGRFAQRPRCSLVFITGNHDHSLIDPAVQARLTRDLGLGGTTRVSFANFYEDPVLRLYADHGNQYDRNNTYDDFARFDWKQDCRGYYFVKLFFNRIEYRDPRVENSPSGWGAVWHWLRRIMNFKLLATAIRYYWQYATDARVPQRITAVGERGLAESAAGTEILDLAAAPGLLVAGGAARSSDSFFSEDPETEQFLREAYHVSSDVRRAVNEILEAQDIEARGKTGAARGIQRPARPGTRPARKPSARRRPEVPQAKEVARGPAVERGIVGPPEDIHWAESLFSDKPYFRDRLKENDFRYVLFGHTHGALVHPLSKNVTYLNTGTWSAACAPVVVAECPPGGAPTAKLLRFEGGKLLQREG